MRFLVACALFTGGFISAEVAARPIVIPILDDRSFAHVVLGENVSLLKLASPTEQGIAVFAYPSALGKSGLWGARLPGVLPVIEDAWPIPETPNLAVDSLIATNRAGMVAYRSAIQFQTENSIVIAGPIRGPANTGNVRVVPVWSFVDVTDPAIDEEGHVYFGARGDDGLSRLWRIGPAENAPSIYQSHWTILETIRAVVTDSSCGLGGACTLAVLFERSIGPGVFHLVWAQDLYTDAAPVTVGPFPPHFSSLDSVNGEVSVVECHPNDVGSGRVLTVIEGYGAVSPPRVTAEAAVNAANLNRLQNFCGVRLLPHYPGSSCPPVIGGTDGALFFMAQTREGGAVVPIEIGVGRPLFDSTIQSIATNPRAINNRGDICFAAQLTDGSSWLLYLPMLRESCPGDADGDLRVTFGDVTIVLANFGAMLPPGGAGGFCVPTGDSDFDRTVSFADVTASLGNFGADCR